MNIHIYFHKIETTHSRDKTKNKVIYHLSK